jgi:rubrerythrin
VSALTRRSLIRRGLLGAGAAAAPSSLIAAATAHAQSTAQTDALERLVTLEQAAELAFSLAAEEGDVDADAKSLFEELSLHAEDHAAAFSEAMDQLLVDPPESDSDPGEYERLEDFDPGAAQADLLDFFIDLEADLVAAYEEENPELDEADLVRTAAQVGASHAQALVALRLLAKEKGEALTKLPPPSTSATDSEEDDSGS